MPGRSAASWASGTCSRAACAGWAAPSASTRSSIDAGTGAHLWAEQMDVDQGTLATSAGQLRHREPPGEDAQCRARQRRGPPGAARGSRRGGPHHAWLVDLECRAEHGTMCRGRSRCSRTRCDIDPDNSQASVGLAQALTLIYRNRWVPERATLLARADEAATRAIAVAPDYCPGAVVKAEVLGLSSSGSMRRLRRMTGPSPSIATSRRACRTRTEPDRGRSGGGGRGARRNGPSVSARAIPISTCGTTSSATRTRTWRGTPGDRMVSQVARHRQDVLPRLRRSRLRVRVARPDRRGGGRGGGDPEAEARVHRAADAGRITNFRQSSLPQGIPADCRGSTQGGVARKLARSGKHDEVWTNL